MMSTQVLEAFGQILTDGLLQIRAASSLPFCKLEADHLHNIPFLILSQTRELIDYYFTVEKPSYLARLSADEKLLAEQRYGKRWNKPSICVTE